MGLDIALTVVQPCEVFSNNITHNLTEMACEAGLYTVLWRPEEMNLTKARMVIPLLEQRASILVGDPERFRCFDAPNGWGRYEHLVAFVMSYLTACRRYPDADVNASR